MTTIVTRAGKGSPLTHTEVDTNFTNLNTAKLEAGAIALGTAAAPSISFTSDTNTGIFSPGADQLAISTGGSRRLLVSNTQIQSDVLFSIAMGGVGFQTIFRNGANEDNFITHGASGFTAFRNHDGTEYMRLTSAGLLGLGASSPSSLLHLVSSGQPKITVADDGGRTLQIHAPDSSANPGFIGTTTNHDLSIQAGTTAGGLNVMRFNTAGAERVRITDTGAVGIGTTTVSSKLHVAGGGSGSRGALRFSDDGGTNYWEIGRDNTSTGDFTFNLNSSEKARIDISGRLLVGTSSSLGAIPGQATQKLQVAGSTDGGITMATFGTDAFACNLEFRKSRSATVGTNTIVQSGDTLGKFYYCGADGTNYLPAAAIEAFVDGTPGLNDLPGRLVFSTTADGSASPTERMRITSTGQVRLAGAGITFNGDTAAANELDDYEEGTWTPSLGGNTTYNYQQGNYTKIGRFVYIRGALSIATLGTGSTTDITGLPFSTGSITGRFGGNVHYFNTTAVNVLNLTVFLNVNTVSFSNISTAGTGTTDSPAIFGNNAAVQFTVCYQV